MIPGIYSRSTSLLACALIATSATLSLAQGSGSCSEISNDVRAAVEKDPSKVLMVVEDALVINEGCAADIVRSAIVAAKADSTLAGQIVQTATSVAPKMTAAINEAANSVAPGFTAAPAPAMAATANTVLPPVSSGKNPSGKNPGKSPVEPVQPVEPSDDFFVPASIRGVFLIQPPASGPLPPRPQDPNPVSPAIAR
jgi:hypothetical protein